MSWMTVAQVLVLLGAASGYMWVSGRDREEPTATQLVEQERLKELRTLTRAKRHLLARHASQASRGYSGLARKTWDGATRTQGRIAQLEDDLGRRVQ